MTKPKFKIGDIVSFKNESSYNPANKVTTIGKIESINIFNGRDITYSPAKGETMPRSLKGKVSYCISAHSLIMDENDIKLYKIEEEENEIRERSSMQSKGADKKGRRSKEN